MRNVFDYSFYCLLVNEEENNWWKNIISLNNEY